MAKKIPDQMPGDRRALIAVGLTMLATLLWAAIGLGIGAMVALACRTDVVLYQLRDWVAYTTIIGGCFSALCFCIAWLSEK